MTSARICVDFWVLASQLCWTLFLFRRWNNLARDQPSNSLCFKHAMNILSVNGTGNKQPLACVWLALAGARVKFVRWRSSRWDRRENKEDTTPPLSLSTLPFPIPPAFHPFHWTITNRNRNRKWCRKEVQPTLRLGQMREVKVWKTGKNTISYACLFIEHSISVLYSLFGFFAKDLYHKTEWKHSCLNHDLLYCLMNQQHNDYIRGMFRMTHDLFPPPNHNYLVHL